MKKKYCIVTGAGKGIGNEVCNIFISRGYDCIAIDNDIASLEKFDKNVFPLKYDLLDINSFKNINIELKKILKDCNDITLVNNIGGSLEKSILENMDIWEKHTRTFEFNIKPMIMMNNIVSEFMKKRGAGKIVNISSISARAALDMVGEEYAASKAAIIGISRKESMNLSKYNILVNTVCPGIINTERIKKRWENRDQTYNNMILEKIPLKRLGNPVEVAKAVYFLGSSENTYITGAVLDVNGGMYMQ
ncbi:SDR family NAD(P)-dependent oxidoreductase [Clostridium felsineum]|uniref:SDR family NAD(P)-dependent oxidoreductase n=1 Tax=Clostridium felsineum TaxID=36839 RepID=UPI00098C31CD|nr:SDR family oxidoreductase [Clostridium felsineum]URZ03773.1 3-oxoacyl-[acyl-carrier-protein] reductase FabG [Clostridium felsineum]